LADAFLAASRSGDVAALGRLLAADAVAYTDGGGRKAAALNPIRGRDKLLRFYAGLARKAGQLFPEVVYRGRINGLAGFITVEADDTLQTTALDIRDGAIAALYIVRNPEKLAHLDRRRLAGG
jgi:RNA polymerase sigma-70 factor (ECF subfamily)